MDALAAAHDAAVQMIDTSVVRVHQHGASIAGNREQHMGRSRGGLTSKIYAVVDADGLPVRLGLTPGEAHDNRLCSVLLTRIASSEQCCWPIADMTRTGSGSLPVNKVRGQTSRRNEIGSSRSASAPTSTERAIWSSGSSTRSSNAGASPPDTTSSPPTTLPSSNLRQSGFGYVLMSPRPNWHLMTIPRLWIRSVCDRKGQLCHR